MSFEHYPDEVEIVETNFKTDQQEDAAETIADEWPVDLDRLAEEGQHVKMFYKQVLEQFLGPAEEDATFAQLKDEYGSMEQWAENGDAESDAEEMDVPDADDIEPGVGESDDGTSTGIEPDADMSDRSTETSPTSDGEALSSNVDAAAVETAPDGVDAKRRAWFRAGFREGVEFAVENHDLFRDE
ncbi:hypothetical protein HSBGL_1802 [Halapricum desulfuricans]|uniref:Uncharacterized protein n=1 Tax=Halapricum desulfuricans TaxID=2841257 RepID=A0A897NMS7_9EURY|nr:hypothetical protein [Halapricum desulfuricans]QSG12213.1 hypothetical protein HSBGL_1802 [Halapricum desulfuricans]